MEQTENNFLKDIRACTRYIFDTRKIKIAFFTSTFFAISVIVLSLIFPTNWFLGNDFRIFYHSAELIFSKPTNLYTLSEYNMPFRYLPLFSIIIFPYTLMPINIAFIINTILMELFHILSFYIVYILITKFYFIEFSTKIQKDLIFLGLLAPLQVPILLLGQMTQLFIFLTLLIILILENQKSKRYKVFQPYFIIGSLTGLSISFKPFAVLLLPFLFTMSINIGKKQLKHNLRQVVHISVGLLCSFVFNILFWLHFPKSIFDFFIINSSTQLYNYPSSSLTRFLVTLFDLMLFSIPELLLTLIITTFLYTITFYLWILNLRNEKNFSLYFGQAILTVMLAFSDSWFLNFLIWYLISLPGIFKVEKIFKERQSIEIDLNYKYYNVIDYLAIQYGIIYFSMGIVIGLFFFPTDPILPFILLISFFSMSNRLFKLIS